ncbi:SSI family serine proteinase inhibitor [Nonomuraea sp. NPDC005983]|uniref:SSI family serine proteinase inhibitor n=1 Tax=Nonomuraea sp. NPDC005983 TaxID=3155595 RepID=UPI00339E5063
MSILRSLARPAAVTAAVLAAATLGVAAPAQAGGLEGELRITVSDIQRGTSEYYVLTCGPDGGSHPTPRDACANLRDLNGDLDAIREPGRPCVKLWSPRHVEIRGYFHDQSVYFDHEYPNAHCMAMAASPIVPSQWR